MMHGPQLILMLRVLAMILLTELGQLMDVMVMEFMWLLPVTLLIIILCTQPMELLGMLGILLQRQFKKYATVMVSL